MIVLIVHFISLDAPINRSIIWDSIGRISPGRGTLNMLRIDVPAQNEEIRHCPILRPLAAPSGQILASFARHA